MAVASGFLPPDFAPSQTVVVIAGKGHETTQIIGSESQAFDDRLVARAALTESGWTVT